MALTYRRKKIEDLVQEIMNKKLLALETMSGLKRSNQDKLVHEYLRGKLVAYELIINHIRQEFDINEDS